MKEGNLWNYFEGLSPDPGEVFIALRSMAGGSTGRDRKRVTLGTPPRFTVGTTGSGNPWIGSVVPLDQNETRVIAAECASLLTGPRRWVTAPMTGRFRIDPTSFVGPDLQIRAPSDLNVSPLTSLAPHGLAELSHQPSLRAVLVDVAFDGAEDPFVDLARRDRARREATNLVALASWPPLEGHSSGQETWTLVWDPESDTIRNARLIPGFHHSDAAIQDRPPTVDARGPIPLVEHERFAAGPYDLPAGQLHICESLPSLLVNYWGLDLPIRRRADRAMTWFAAARRAQDPGTAITSYVTAIEALLPAVDSSPCKHCGQRSLTISKRFSHFLDQFAGSAMRKEFRDEIYSVRSGISHGVRLYEVDHHLFGVTDDSQLDHMKAWGTVRAALLNWLLAQTPKSA